MNKTKIEWCDSTWNPVTGCLHGGEYCYARRIAQRFGGGESWDRGSSYSKKLHVLFTRPEKPYPFYFEPTLHGYRLGEPANKTKPQTIFVCSMADLFGEWVPDEWIRQVLDTCLSAPQHRYLFLTKNPDRYTEVKKYMAIPGPPLPLDTARIGLWLGASATNNKQLFDAHIGDASWISVEPMHERIDTELLIDELPYDGTECPRWRWVVIGAETGSRKDKVVPKREWIEEIVDVCAEWGTPVFMKDSLAGVWGGPLLREFPWK